MAPESAWKRFKGRDVPASLRLWPVFDDFFGPKDRLLDLGCGYGRSCAELRQKGFLDYFGLDLNLSGLKEARRWMAEEFPERPRPSFQAGDGANLPFGDGSFDGLIMQAFLTTLDKEARRRAVAAESARVLVPGGRLYLADYGRNLDNPVYLERYEEGRRMGLEPGAFPARDKDTGEILFIARHYTRAELVGLFSEAGFSIAHHSTQTFVTWTGNRVLGHLLIGLREGPSRPRR
jgi:SAM-dependent methyltransferase